MENRFWLILYTRHGLGTEAEAARLLDFLNQSKSISQPGYFDKNEPVRKVLNAKTLPAAVAMLSGAPKYKLGSMMLRSKDSAFLADLKWHSTKTAKWLIEFSGAAYADPAGWQSLIDFCSRLCRAFPALAGGCAPYEDWNAKHWREIISAGGAKGIRKSGLDFTGSLTGIYWLTLLGPAAVAHFGKAALSALPVHQAIDLDAGGMLLVLRPSPVSPARDARLAQDRAIAAALGQDYCFDIAYEDRELKPIPGLD